MEGSQHNTLLLMDLLLALVLTDPDPPDPDLCPGWEHNNNNNNNNTWNKQSFTNTHPNAVQDVHLLSLTQLHGGHVYRGSACGAVAHV